MIRTTFFLCLALWSWGRPARAVEPPVCPTLLTALVADGKMSPEFARAFQSLVDAGPEKWVKIAGQGVKGPVFQRGVSGALGMTSRPGPKHLVSGAEDAVTVLLGEGNAKEVHTSVMPNLKASSKYLEGINRAYSFPLTIRGSATEAGVTEVTEPDIGMGGVTVEPGALIPSRIEGMGIFFQDSGNRSADYYWASNYLALMKRLKDTGVTPKKNSRGERFLRDVESVWENRRWHYDYKEGFGVNELANETDVLMELGTVFRKYGRPD